MSPALFLVYMQARDYKLYSKVQSDRPAAIISMFKQPSTQYY